MLPVTEWENPLTAEIDTLPTLDALRLINREDRRAAEAVEEVLPQIAAAVDKIAERIRNGGRLFYVGAGSSGRLGVLDASECPPTFGVSPETVQGIIAGGYDALYKAVEASEDDAESGKADLQKRGVTEKDAVVGIAASGGTPYTVGAVGYGRKLGCFTACVACVPDSAITKAVEIPIVPVVGAEVLTGSTRMKAGTAQKMVLNMLSTMTMIRLGYVSGNRMTNVSAKNEKLKARSLRILVMETGLNESEARNLMNKAQGDLRTAIVMHRAAASPEEARKALAANDFAIETAIASLIR